MMAAVNLDEGMVIYDSEDRNAPDSGEQHPLQEDVVKEEGSPHFRRVPGILLLGRRRRGNHGPSWV